MFSNPSITTFTEYSVKLLHEYFFWWGGAKGIWRGALPTPLKCYDSYGFQHETLDHLVQEAP